MVAAVVYLTGQTDEVARLYAEAQKAQTAGDLPGAAHRYESILKLRPQMAEGWANLGNLYYQQGQTDKARSSYRKAIQLKPDLAGPNFFLGVISFASHEYKEALRYLERAEAADASNAAIESYLGYTRYALGNFHMAVGALEKAHDLNPADIDVLYHLSKSYGHLAAEHYQRLQTSFPDSVYTILSRAHLAETREEWKEARKQYALVLEKLPENKRVGDKLQWLDARIAGSSSELPGPADLLVDASLSYRDLQLSGPELSRALLDSRLKLAALRSSEGKDETEYRRAEISQVLSYLSLLSVLNADPDSYRAHQLRAQMLEQSRDEEGAIREYREALKRRPDLQNIHFSIGSLYWKDQRFDQARAELLQEIKLNPNHPEALYELGDILVSEGDTAGAEKHYLSALKLEPGMVEAHLALEKIYTQSERYGESMAQLQQVSRLSPGDPAPHYRRAVIYRKLGKNQEAESELAIFKQKQAAQKK